MSKLISGKEAIEAFLNGNDVEFSVCGSTWENALNVNIGVFLSTSKFSDFKFRLKPKTIKLNNIEVPAPFLPKEGDTVFIPSNFIEQGCIECRYPTFHGPVYQFGAWRTEEEIKQVIEALRSVFKSQ